MPWRVFFLIVLSVSLQLHADHIARFEVKELEWNGTLKKYGNGRKVEAKFSHNSTPVYIDSFAGSALFVKFVFAPVFSDKGQKPAFYAIVFDSNHRDQQLFSKSIFERDLYDASAREKDQSGTRRWAGKLKYIPDTAIKNVRPAWGSDHFTLMIEKVQCWRDLKKGKKPIIKGKRLKKLYYEGYTGVPSEPKYAGKIGLEKWDIVMDPVRYQWGDEIWFEFTMRLYATTPDGKRKEILAHKFDSRNKDLQYGEVVKENAYEVRDSRSEVYMLLQRVYLIPY